jgi:hypothetical protein
MKVGVTLLLALVCAGCSTASSATPRTEVPNANPTSSDFTATGSPVTAPSEMSVQDAVAAIGAKCGAPKTYEAKCTWDGPEFSVVYLPHEKSYKKLRDQLCDQFGLDFLILTDGKSWSVYADEAADADTKIVAKAMLDTGLKGDLEPYC